MAQQSTGTVTVACKLPMGLLLRTFEMRKVRQLSQAGTAMDVDEAFPKERQHFIYGVAFKKGEMPKSAHADGFALTPGVPAELWNEWHEQNKDSDLVRNGLIFAHGDERSVKSQAVDHAKQKSGLERLDPNAMPKGLEPANGKKAS